MGGQGRLIGGLALCLMGVLGVCLTCGLPMWRETSFVGANVVTVWDGLWLHCIVQATGQMQCKRHTTGITMTSDIQAGRALTLISIIAGILGFIACLLGGALCLLSGILCLVSVTWSAVATISIYNDPLVTAALKREVGSSVYIGWASSVLLLLGGALFCFVCGDKKRSQPSYYYMPSNFSTQSSDSSSQHKAQVHRYNYLNNAPSVAGLYNQSPTHPQFEQSTFGRNSSNRSQTQSRIYNSKSDGLLF
uniref:Claudin n=1 Tax=Stegastes partitus TaxID=144197 RepID=A0A3B5AUM9_9TELE